jgi:N-acetylmuramoyl-L-alanine amidase
MARRPIAEVNKAASFWQRVPAHQVLTVVFLVLGLLVVVVAATYFGRISDDTVQVYAIAPPAPVSAQTGSVFRVGQSPGRVEVGLIAGHLGSDSGAVCEDGQTEQEINVAIAEGVKQALRERGHTATVLEEFDPRIETFGGSLVVSIHADSCDDFGEDATGFKIAEAPAPGSAQLKACVFGSYASETGLRYHANTVTLHMTDYHVFRELPANVPAIIIETGFMRQDRELLTTNRDVPAAGITDGILCYLEKAQ